MENRIIKWRKITFSFWRTLIKRFFVKIKLWKRKPIALYIAYLPYDLEKKFPYVCTCKLVEETKEYYYFQVINVDGLGYDFKEELIPEKNQSFLKSKTTISFIY